jgi:NAD(P)-dependent dehydrogenase (short-subunit alcohol dehydrogenase family)
MRLDDKIAVVTGAAKGIGAGIAERFLEAGAAVVAFDIDGVGAKAIAERLAPKGRILAIEGDVSQEAHVNAAVEQTVACCGGLDILVNNAAIAAEVLFADCAAEQWDRHLAVNLRGPFLFVKYAIPHMRARGGVIINISSVKAFVAYPGNAPYDASKAGLVALTRSLALELGPHKIRVNAICPGYIDTPMTQEWLATVPDPAEAMRQVLAVHPLGRIGTPRDVADAALFLASDAASFISGTCLTVDGALTAGGR